MQRQRERHLERLATQPHFDLVVIGGGATGLGVALDAVTRGLKVALFEAQDFASGTSSKATKLVHGGVRYLAQGHLPLVYEALHERASILRNAPHVAKRLSLVTPCYQWWEKPFYGLGLSAYDWLSGKQSLGATHFFSKTKTIEALPNVRQDQLLGGVRYWDGQFDDARLAIDLARTAQHHGALVMNYCAVTQLSETAGKVSGAVVTDQDTGKTYAVSADCVVNATGVWVDALRGAQSKPLVQLSRGVHVVVDASFMPSAPDGTQHALLIPKTSDGRVIFIVPWLGSLILGTTDASAQTLTYEPCAQEAEIALILSECAKYLQCAPTLQDIKSVWAGLRPLVQPASEGATKSTSREHYIEVAPNGLLSVTGGKWTTYRRMAQDVVDTVHDQHLVRAWRSKALPPCQTQNLELLGADSPWLGIEVQAPTDAQVEFAVVHEFARTVEDLLARRSRCLFLDAKKAQTQAQIVALQLQNLGVQNTDLDAFIDKTIAYQVGHYQTGHASHGHASPASKGYNVAPPKF